ncbi:MAG: fuculose phosphate aldolase [Candidatus Riflebacteria bacterium HGW-Riflebacteria-2]|jgi:L-fuculose-phosphate aldolase|nr:MAG: fuculose phosphate aldolase [Candidatus Riflebacteria bacterium HGW-Riflebacteria-2]
MTILRDFQLTGEDLFVAGLNNSHSGNMSVRNNRMMAITRSGAMLHRLEYSDIIETLIDGEDSQTPLASRERLVHRAIYLQTGANAIVHAHPPHLIALSLHCKNFMPIDAEGQYFFKRGIPVIEVTNAIASEEVAAKVVPVLREFPMVIVRGHGTFAIGDSLEDGFHFTSSLEHSARIALINNQTAKTLT